jgi:hypothetical protein
MHIGEKRYSEAVKAFRQVFRIKKFFAYMKLIR